MEDLIAKYLAGELDEKERTEFEQKLIQDEAFTAQVESHMLAMFLSEPLQTNAHAFDTVSAWQKVKSKTHPATNRKGYYPLKIAASFVLFATLGYVLLNTLTNVEFNEIQASHQTQQEIKEIILPDGSAAKLNRASTITFADGFGDTHRQVQLLGAANFDVVSNKDLPFQIHTANSKVSVLGTSFDLSAYPEEQVELNVTEGTVSFESTVAKISKQVVKAGERAALSKDGKRLIREKRKNKNYTAWWSKQLVFESSALKDVAKDLEKAYWVNIDVAEGIANCKLDAVITSKPLADVLTIIQANFPSLKVVQTKENQIKLDGKSCTD